MRKFGRWVALVLVAATSIPALGNILDEFRHTSGVMQKSVAVAVTGYAVLGVVLAVGMFRRQRWAVPISLLWSACVIWAATVASVAFNETRTREVLIGAASAFIACAIVGWLVVWAAREWVRPPTPDLDSVA